MKMDILKRNLAPITDKAWEEIEDLASDILKIKLAARRFVDVSEPKGMDHGAEIEGRLHIPENQDEDDVMYGVHKVLPLIEARKSFTLDIWELDNIERGAKDIDLAPLEEAVSKIADFEDNAIFHGVENANIEGLVPSTKERIISCKKTCEDLLASINQAVTTFQNDGIGGPYLLVINPDVWQNLLKGFKGYPLRKHVSGITNGSIVFSDNIKGAFLVSARGGDFELILGHDYDIGYENHDHQGVQLFISESFTFRILEPKAIIKLRISSE